MGLVVTHSDIKTFLTCRRRWYWSYVLDFKKPEKLSGHLALGTRVHASLEEYYRDGKDPLEVHETLAMEDVAATEVADVPPWELDQLYKDIVVGRNCILAHQEWLADEGVDAPYVVETVEQTIEAPILGGAVTLRGKVDVLFRDVETGFLAVNDLKTAGKKTVREELERSYQHHVYLAVLKLIHPERVVDSALYTVMFKGARAASVERYRVPGTTRMAEAKLRQIEAICTEMLRALEQIETEGAANAYPTPQDACRWCEFSKPCEVFDESPLAARAMLDSEYTRGGRHHRYSSTPP